MQAISSLLLFSNLISKLWKFHFGPCPHFTPVLKGILTLVALYCLILCQSMILHPTHSSTGLHSHCFRLKYVYVITMQLFMFKKKTFSHSTIESVLTLLFFGSYCGAVTHGPLKCHRYTNYAMQRFSLNYAECIRRFL